VTFPELSYQSLWRNRLARSAVKRKVGGSFFLVPLMYHFS